MVAITSIPGAQEKEYVDGRTGVVRAYAQGANFSLSIPPGCYLQNIAIQNLTANAITGGLDVGTTAAGADVVSALAVGANAITDVPDAGLLKQFFPTAALAGTTLYFTAHTSWNSASINVFVLYQIVQ